MFIIYHNPRCSKSREALRLLGDRGETPTIVEYLKEPLSKEDLRRLLDMLHLEAHDIVRTGENAYEEQGLSRDASTEDIIAAIARCPSLLQRPIVVRNGKAVIGRPPEKVIEILDGG